MKCFSQNAPITEPQLMYLKHIQFGANANTFRMGGVQFRYGWHKTGSVFNHFESELSRIKHPKEIRRSGFTEQPSQYSYGRMNMVFFWRNGFGQTINITERPYKNALGLNFVYTVGASMAILKPVYIDVFYPYTDGSPNGYLVSEKYDPEKHQDIFRIYGNSSIFAGLGEAKAQIGGYGRGGLQVEWGQYPDETRSLEAGITVDAFLNGLPMMAKQPYDNRFIGFYLAFNWGYKN
jgi:hypothetical protein